MSHYFFSFSQNLCPHTWVAWSDIPTLPFPLFNPFSQFFCHSLLILLLGFSSHFCYVCLLSIFFHIFIVILYNPICSYIVLHMLYGVMFPMILLCCCKICTFLFVGICFFSVVLRSQWIGTSLYVILFRWSYMFCIFLHFWHFFYVQVNYYGFWAVQGVGLFLPFLGSLVRSGSLGKGQE